MTQEDIIHMAREAGLPEIIDNANIPWAELSAFAVAIREDERNAIAIEFEERHEAVKHRNNYWLHAANYVRARGQA